MKNLELSKMSSKVDKRGTRKQMNQCEYFHKNMEYIITATRDNYTIETYSTNSTEILNMIKEKLTEKNGYCAYVVYKLFDDNETYYDFERWNKNHNNRWNIMQ